MSDSEKLELAMRSILRLFTDGRLVYRKRESVLDLDVGARARRVRAIRQELAQ